ncbi:MAG: hypothetical protein ACLU38_01360 [Dysosmobacter sp.]
MPLTGAPIPPALLTGMGGETTEEDSVQAAVVAPPCGSWTCPTSARWREA